MTVTDPDHTSDPPSRGVKPLWLRLIVGRHPKRTLVRAVTIGALLFVAGKWCLQPIRISGHSMEPTYHNGRINFLNRMAYRLHGPVRGDVAGIRLAERRMVLMKRVVGLPGERVILRDGIVAINGSPLHEPYALGDDLPSMNNEVTLGADEYFVIGDNRDASEYGVVKRSEILGKIFL